MKKFVDHLVTNFNGKIYANGWMRIDGSSFCSECAAHKKSSLYVYAGGDSPVYFYCFRTCGESRVLTIDDLQTKFNIEDNKMIEYIVSLNGKYPERKFSINNSVNELVVRTNVLSSSQIEYFRKRTKITIKNLTDIKKYNLIPNIVEVLQDNFYNNEDIFKHVKNDKFMGYRAEELIAFHSKDYLKFIVRGIKSDLKSQLSISDNENVSPYVLTRGTEISTLVLTEGVFDCINIFNTNKELDNAVFIATLGFAAFEKYTIKAFKDSLEYMDNGARIIYFADSDKKDVLGKPDIDHSAYKALINKLVKQLGDDSIRELSIVYNKASKDFGDLSLNIEPEVIKVIDNFNILPEFRYSSNGKGGKRRL